MLCGLIVPFFLLVSSIPLCGYTVLFICSPGDGPLGCFQFGAVRCKAAVNIYISVFVWTCAITSPG